MLVAKKARRPSVPPQSVLLKTLQAQELGPDLDAVLSKWGAKSAAAKRDSAFLRADERGAAPAAAEYGVESVWAVRQVPGDEGAWECEEMILDAYMDRSRDSLPMVGVAA